MANNESVSVLNSLIETLKDGENGFRHAADHAKDPSLKSIFDQYASQRASYSQELQSAVASLGDKPAESGHVAGALHRGWMSIKEAVSKNDDKALVDEAEAGEDAAMKAYREALSSGISGEALAIVERQFQGVQQAHSVIRDLKHNWTGSAARARA